MIVLNLVSFSQTIFELIIYIVFTLQIHLNKWIYITCQILIWKMWILIILPSSNRQWLLDKSAGISIPFTSALVSSNHCQLFDRRFFPSAFFFINVCDAWLPSMPSSQITISFWWSSPVTHGQLFNPCVRPADRCIYHHRDGTPISSIRSWFLIPLCHRQWRTDARFIPEQLN